MVGIFSNQKYLFGSILEGLGMENDGRLAIWNMFVCISRSFWYILRPFGNFVVIWYVFFRFGTLCQEKSGNPGARPLVRTNLRGRLSNEDF
jgi:hypothetical protein